MSSSISEPHLPLSGVGGSPGNFPFHLVFFPAARFLSGEGFSVVPVVAWITATERGVVNLLPYPSLPWGNCGSAVGALRAADEHLFLQVLACDDHPAVKTTTVMRRAFRYEETKSNVKNLSRTGHLSEIPKRERERHQVEGQ